MFANAEDHVHQRPNQTTHSAPAQPNTALNWVTVGINTLLSLSHTPTGSREVSVNQSQCLRLLLSSAVPDWSHLKGQFTPKSPSCHHVLILKLFQTLSFCLLLNTQKKIFWRMWLTKQPNLQWYGSQWLMSTVWWQNYWWSVSLRAWQEEGVKR